MSMGDFINKAKELISEHPDQARDALNRAEQMLNQQTGGKYTDQISKGGDMLEGRLGFPDEQASQPNAPADTAPQGGTTEPVDTPEAVDTPETAGPSATDSALGESPTTAPVDPVDSSTDSTTPSSDSGEDTFGLNPRS